MRSVPSALVLLALACLAACGDDDGARPRSVGGLDSTPLPEGCQTRSIDPATVRVPRPMTGVYFGREIWLSYHSKEHEGDGMRFPRTREEALHKIRQLCTLAHGGADMGELARKWSNAAGGRAGGLCAVPLPANRDDPDARDIALFRTPIGSFTPLLEWRGGFWFAQRISEREGRELGLQLQEAARTRARARVIHIHHAGAWPRRVEFDKHPKERAIQTARWIIQEVQKGAAFDALARKYSNDGPSRARGGLLETKHPVTGETTDWIRWGDRNFPEPVLDVILEKGTPGEVWPEPVVSGWGVDVVLVLERRTD